MQESKLELTERLRRENRWQQASLFKDETLKKLRSDGMTKADAGEEAWKRIAAQYPPLNLDESDPETSCATTAEPTSAQWPKSSKPDIDVDALLERIGDSQPSDLTRDTLWAYENLANLRIKASNAPSCGAWALLAWARQYRNRFFEQVLPKAMSNKPPEEEEKYRQEEMKIDEIQEILERMKKQVEEETIRDLQKNTTSTIQAKVHKIVQEWEEMFKAPLADNARNHLEAHFGRFAQTCMNAAGGELESSSGSSIP